jgi:SAM-dependent methyltransferase
MTSSGIDLFEQLECPVCGAAGNATSVVGTDRWFGTPGRWPIVKCSSPDCDLRWLHRRPADHEISALYANYHTHDPRPKSKFRRFAPHPLAARALQKREENFIPSTVGPGRVLEIGCGDGHNLKQLQRSGWEVVGQEIDQVAAARASQLLNARVHVGALDQCDFGKDPFDLILTSHVLEHVSSPNEVAEFAFSVLRPGGWFVNYTPNANSFAFSILGGRWRALEPPRHLVLLGPKSGRRTLESAGFRDVEISSLGAGGGWVFADSVAPDAKGLTRVLLTVFGQFVEDVSRTTGCHRHWELRLVARRPVL